MTFLFVVLGLALAVYIVRLYLVYSETPAIPKSQFSGDIYIAGDSMVAKRKMDGKPARSIICMPGFLETPQYFMELYKDVDAELILINNLNYHSPFILDKAKQVDWSAANEYAPGTIEHDAYFLGQVMTHLATTENVLVHGHSRGGAVVLDAGRQFPALMGSVSALLEAPVLPQALVAGRPDPRLDFLKYFGFPFLFTLMRLNPAGSLAKSPMMRPNNELKQKTLLHLYQAPKQYKTAVVNIRSITDWQRDTPISIFNNIKDVTVVVGARDSVLNLRSMISSAEQAQNVRVVKTEKTNHFVSLETPELMQELIAAG